MEVILEDIPCRATMWEVKDAIAQVLHSPRFRNPAARNARLLNFRIELEKSTNGLPNNGTGRLIIPDRDAGQQFLKWVFSRGNAVLVLGKRLWMKEHNESPSGMIVKRLLMTPYLDPMVEQERQDKVDTLRRVRIILDAIQFGTYFRKEGEPNTANRSFSNEFEIRRTDTFSGELMFDYDHKLFRIETGNWVTEDDADQIVVDLDNIRKSAYGRIEVHGEDGGSAIESYICLDLWHPPRLERQKRYRKLTGDWEKDKCYRDRLPHLGGFHEHIAPYAYQLRLVLNDPAARKDLKFLCKEADIQPPSKAAINVENGYFFHPERLAETHDWMRTLDWTIQFQLEGLLRNGFVHTWDLHELSADIEELAHTRPAFASNILRRFSERVRMRGPGESLLECFRAHVENDGHDAEMLAGIDGHDPEEGPRGTVECAHAVVTPTRVLLEGPYDTQSNRIIRKYYEHRGNFIRVEFRDENRLAFRWPKEVDSKSLIEKRIGNVLKHGLEIAGRLFRFLGYSNSGMREHTVWFMADFDHPVEGRVTPEKIRNDLGDFSSCIRIPSKYAARIAQAFSGTDPSVRIRRDQWDEMEDLGKMPYLHTDGQGTISVMLRDLIWDALVKASPELARLLKPWAFQIRFLGYKGVVVVDETLEGIRMRLRPSMKKYTASNDEEAEIEIAKAFVYPGPARLCRPLITVLEDRGVAIDSFLALQRKATEKVITSSDKMETAIEFVREHSLGTVYGLPWILAYIAKSGIRMDREKCPTKLPLDCDLINAALKFSKSHILREIKHDARIRIENAHQLVGVVDEGPAYVAAGYENVYCLKPGEIYACVQNPDPLKFHKDPFEGRPHWIKGNVTISRSPHIHPGDVQRVKAIGEPPRGKLCFFSNLRNVVVMPSTGERSLPSCLAGGDVDGDEYLVIKEETLLPSAQAEPASYTGVNPVKLDRDSTIDDVCDFFLEYMQSDIVGLLSDQHLIIADQSKYGVFDEYCMVLARLCSQAVDYPKNGVPVKKTEMPKKLIYAKPDWKKTEDNDPRPGDYYESKRALGELFRNIQIDTIDVPQALRPGEPLRSSPYPSLQDNISTVLRPAVERRLGRAAGGNGDGDAHADAAARALEPLFRHYARELSYICVTHAPADRADVRLSEEEVVVGTILAHCAERRWRKSRTYRMREHAAQLVRDVRYKPRALGVPRPRPRANANARRKEDRDRWAEGVGAVEPPKRRAKDGAQGQGQGRSEDRTADGGEGADEGPAREELVAALAKGWAAWDFGQRYRDAFGARSFGLIGLGVVCDMLEKLEKLDEKEKERLKAQPSR